MRISNAVRSSAPLFIVVVPGSDVVEVLCKGYESIVLERYGDLNYRPPFEDRSFDQAVVRETLYFLREQLPAELKSQMLMIVAFGGEFREWHWNEYGALKRAE